LLLLGVFLAGGVQFIHAQDDGAVPLGDVARSLRKKPAAPDPVIDNDNLTQAIETVESRRAAGTSPVFTLDPGGKSFHVSSPDVTCSLSFSAKSTALLADPVMLDELPRSELAKLDGPATIDGDSLQVSMHNGTAWELREVLIGLTILRAGARDSATAYGPRIVPAMAGTQSPDTAQKQPDVTLLLRVKGSAAPSATATFRAALNFALFPDQEWHWAVVRAKGIAPQEAPLLPTIDPAPGALSHGPENGAPVQAPLATPLPTPR